jgi:hypothetical protein
MPRRSGTGYKWASRSLSWLHASLLRYLAGGGQTPEYPPMARLNSAAQNRPLPFSNWATRGQNRPVPKSRVTRPPTEARRLDGLHPMDMSQICTDAKTLSGSTTSAVLITCLVIGFVAGIIWTTVDPRFSSASLSNTSAQKLVVILAGIAGGAVGLVLLALLALGCHASGV